MTTCEVGARRHTLRPLSDGGTTMYAANSREATEWASTMRRQKIVRPLSVYIVEDSERLAAMLARLLESEIGVRVVGRSAEAGVAGAEIAGLHPDLVLVDLSRHRL